MAEEKLQSVRLGEVFRPQDPQAVRRGTRFEYLGSPFYLSEVGKGVIYLVPEDSPADILEKIETPLGGRIEDIEVRNDETSPTFGEPVVQVDIVEDNPSKYNARLTLNGQVYTAEDSEIWGDGASPGTLDLNFNDWRNQNGESKFALVPLEAATFQKIEVVIYQVS